MKSKIVSFFINGAGRPWCCKFGSSMTRGSEERVSQGSETAVCGAACPHLSGLSGMTVPPSGSDSGIFYFDGCRFFRARRPIATLMTIGMARNTTVPATTSPV